VPETDWDPSVSQDKILHSSKLPSALLAAGSLERSERLKEVVLFVIAKPKIYILFSDCLLITTTYNILNVSLAFVS